MMVEIVLLKLVMAEVVKLAKVTWVCIVILVDRVKVLDPRGKKAI